MQCLWGRNSFGYASSSYLIKVAIFGRCRVANTGALVFSHTLVWPCPRLPLLSNCAIIHFILHNFWLMICVTNIKTTQFSQYTYYICMYVYSSHYYIEGHPPLYWNWFQSTVHSFRVPDMKVISLPIGNCETNENAIVSYLVRLETCWGDWLTSCRNSRIKINTKKYQSTTTASTTTVRHSRRCTHIQNIQTPSGSPILITSLHSDDLKL